MKLLIVDWLGRGGIAECSAALAIEAATAGAEVVVVTRPNRDLTTIDCARVRESASRKTAISSHRALIIEASRVIRDERPDVVIVQNYVVAALERSVLSATRSVGAKGLLVVHDHQMHSRLAGSNLGLRGLTRLADSVVAHSRFVGEQLTALADREVQVTPLPLPLRLLGLRAGHDPLPSPSAGGNQIAVHFGILKRGYKGTALVAQLAAAGVKGWGFVVIGVGARTGPGLTTIPEFVDGLALVEAVRQSTATLLPYRMASQSGAIVLAQALGSVPVATSVGGIPEQIRHGENGVLLPVSSPADAWCSALLALGPETCEQMTRRAQADVSSAHGAFASWVRTVVDGTAA